MADSVFDKSKILSGLILLLVTVSGCGTQELTRSQAVEMIESSAGFRNQSTTTPFLSGETKSISEKDRVLKEFGLVEIIGSGDALAVQVTEKGEQAMIKRPDRDLSLFTLAGGSSETEAWDVPLAKPKFLKTTGIREDSANAASVEFTYQWIPNALGKRLLQVDPDHSHAEKFAANDIRHSSASFEKYDDGWRLVQVERMY